jgi:putative transposase
MPRKARILCDEGYYHVFSRGNDKKIIYRHHEDYEKFLKIVLKYLEAFQISILHYCLMPNHFHFLLQAHQSKDMPLFMKAVLQVYACFFRIKYKTAGFVFQNRYKSKLIDKEAYLLECARYIERNPLRACLCQTADQYPWSSFSHYAKGTKDAIIGKQNPCYLALSKLEAKRQHFYHEYVEEERLYEKIIDDHFRLS